MCQFINIILFLYLYFNRLNYVPYTGAFFLYFRLEWMTIFLHVHISLL